MAPNGRKLENLAQGARRARGFCACEADLSLEDPLQSCQTCLDPGLDAIQTGLRLVLTLDSNNKIGGEGRGEMGGGVHAHTDIHIHIPTYVHTHISSTREGARSHLGSTRERGQRLIVEWDTRLSSGNAKLSSGKIPLGIYSIGNGKNEDF